MTKSKIIGLVILGIIGLSILGLLIKIIFFPINTAQKMIDTLYEAQDKTLNADNAIYNYEWFKRQKESIDATVQKLGIANKTVENFKIDAGERKDWTFEDKTESARLNAISQGIENQLKDMIAEYNARTQMANRAIFQDGILPSYIDALTFIQK